MKWDSSWNPWSKQSPVYAPLPAMNKSCSAVGMKRHPAQGQAAGRSADRRTDHAGRRAADQAGAGPARDRAPAQPVPAEQRTGHGVARQAAVRPVRPHQGRAADRAGRAWARRRRHATRPGRRRRSAPAGGLEPHTAGCGPVPRARARLSPTTGTNASGRLSATQAIHAGDQNVSLSEYQCTGIDTADGVGATQFAAAEEYREQLSPGGGCRQPRQLHPARLPGAGGAADAVTSWAA